MHLVNGLLHSMEGIEMYALTLHILLVGLPDETQEAIRQVSPPDRFSYEFMTTDRLAKETLKEQRFSLVIFTAESMQALSIASVRQAAGSDAKCVLVTAEPQSLMEAELPLLDGIWPSPLTPVLASYAFRRLVARLKARKDAWMEHTYWQTTINSSPDLIWYKDKIGAHVEVNDAFCKAVGKEKENVRGRGHYYIWGLTKEQYAKGEFVCNETEEVVMKEQRPMVFDEHVLSKDNGMRQLRTYKSPIFDEDGSILGTVGVAMDVTKELEYREKLLQIARHDPLTGLPNRRYFFEYAGEHADEPKCLLSLDIDDFKHFNDKFGHLAGDEVLRLFAEILRESFQHGFPTRFGGDEFLVLYTSGYDMDSIRRATDGFRRALLEQSSSRMFGAVRTTIGISRDTSGHLPVDRLYQRADVALYHAKQNGKSQVMEWNGDIQEDG